MKRRRHPELHLAFMRNRYTVSLMNKHQPVSNDPLGDAEDGHILTQAIIDTIHEPLIVLDEDLRIIVASNSFYRKFDISEAETKEKLIYELGNGEWDIPELRKLLKEVLSDDTVVKEYEVERDFPFLGLRTLNVNAREIRYENGRKKMLVSIFDITEQRALEHEKEKLMTQKDLLLKEMRHRIANSLQLIASILLLKAQSVDSKESRAHLEDAHERILSIATVQQQLDPVSSGEETSVAEYLTGLCRSLARSMIGGRKPITITVEAGHGKVSSDTAVSFGLITTELVINAIKHAFPNGQKGIIIVSYSAKGSGWTLCVSDDGIGQSEKKKHTHVGLGTSIIGALANQLHAIIRTTSTPHGTKVSIIHANL